jgi:hypothetical protein
MLLWLDECPEVAALLPARQNRPGACCINFAHHDHNNMCHVQHDMQGGIWYGVEGLW